MNDEYFIKISKVHSAEYLFGKNPNNILGVVHAKIIVKVRS